MVIFASVLPLAFASSQSCASLTDAVGYISIILGIFLIVLGLAVFAFTSLAPSKDYMGTKSGWWKVSIVLGVLLLFVYALSPYIVNYVSGSQCQTKGSAASIVISILSSKNQTHTTISCPGSPFSAGVQIPCNVTVTGNANGGSVLFSASDSTGSFNQSTCIITQNSCRVNFTDNIPGDKILTATYLGTSSAAESSGQTEILLEGNAYDALEEYTNPPGAGTVEPGNGTYVQGTSVTISEVPTNGFVFTGWNCTGRNCFSGFSTNSEIVISLEGNVTETATYTKIGTSPSATSLACSPSSFATGSYTVCTAAVTGNVPAGVVKFSATAGSFYMPACILYSGSCSVNLTAAMPGRSNVTAKYLGSGNNAPSAGRTSVNVT